MSPLPEVDVALSELGGGQSTPAKWGALRRLSSLEQPEWNDLVSSHTEASFFHTSNWAAVLRGAYGHVPHYFGLLRDERLTALLPVMEVNSPLTGRRGVSLPFTDECPFLSDGSASGPDVFQEVIDFGRKRGWRYAETRGTTNLSETTSLSFFGHELDLSEGDRIFGHFDGAVRRAIRKAEKGDVRVEISPSFDSVRTYYSLHCKTRKKHGLPPQPWAFFQSIFDHILSKGLGVVVVARYESRPVAGAVFFHFDGKALYKFGASDPALQHLRGSNLVMWEAIKWYFRQGFASLRFGRTSTANEGLRRFKLGFGTSEYRINYFRYDLRKGVFVSDRDNIHGWFNRFFRLMPASWSRMVGTVLYRHMS